MEMLTFEKRKKIIIVEENFNIYFSLHIPLASNIIQCIASNGQIGFVENNNIEPLHIISFTKQSTVNTMFHRKTGIKKNATKTRQISKDMIGSPQADFTHAFHVGVTGNEKEIWIINKKIGFRRKLW